MPDEPPVKLSQDRRRFLTAKERCSHPIVLPLVHWDYIHGHHTSEPPHASTVRTMRECGHAAVLFDPATG